MASENSSIFRQSSGPSSAYIRHLRQADAYVRFYGGTRPAPSAFNTERQLLEKNHRFLRDDDEEPTVNQDDEKEIARKYYASLYREYALVDLSRWRERQVISTVHLPILLDGVAFDARAIADVCRLQCAGVLRMKCSLVKDSSHARRCHALAEIRFLARAKATN